jgi:hypothetical protein
MGITALGTVVGAVIAGKFMTLKTALKVLPFGVAMGLFVMVMPVTYSKPTVYSVLILVGGLGGFFVVPMNALLQHRGHVLLSAGHSIAVQNFNEQLNILLMVGVLGDVVIQLAYQHRHRCVRLRCGAVDGRHHVLESRQPSTQSQAGRHHWD